MYTVCQGAYVRSFIISTIALPLSISRAPGRGNHTGAASSGAARLYGSRYQVLVDPIDSPRSILLPYAPPASSIRLRQPPGKLVPTLRDMTGRHGRGVTGLSTVRSSTVKGADVDWMPTLLSK